MKFNANITKHILNFIISSLCSYIFSWLIILLINKNTQNLVLDLIPKFTYLNDFWNRPIFHENNPITMLLVLTIAMFAFITYKSQTSKSLHSYRSNENNNIYGSARFATIDDVLKWAKDKFTDILMTDVPSYKNLGDSIFDYDKQSGGGAVVGRTTPNTTNKLNSNLKYSKDRWLINTGDNNTLGLGTTRSGKGVTIINPLLHNLALSKGKINLNARKDKDIFNEPDKLVNNISSFEQLEQYFSPWFKELYESYQVLDSSSDKQVRFFERFKPQVSNVTTLTKLKDLDVFILAPNQNVLIPDFKGELLKIFGGFYKKMGYNVINIDLGNPMESSSFNFLTEVRNLYLNYINSYYKLINLKSKLNVVPTQEDLKLINTYEKQFREQKSLADKSLRKIANAIFPLEGNDSDKWINWAKSIFQASCFITIIEICHKAYKTDDENLKQRLLKTVNMNSCLSTYSKYLQENESGAYFSAEQIAQRHPFLTTEEAFIRNLTDFWMQPVDTRGNIMGNVGDEVTLFSSDIKYCFSQDDFSLDDIVGFIPTAIFMAIPEDDSLYKFGSLIVDLLWNKIWSTVKKMKKNERLPINLNVVLDEFGNLPKISGMTQQISAGLSMGVRTYIIVQAIQQIDKIYGAENCKVIVNNCNNLIYAQVPDYETRHWLSERIGNTTVEVTKIVPKRRPGDVEYKETTQEKRPLITPEDMLLESNEARSKFDTIVQYINKPTIVSAGVVYFNFEDISKLRFLTTKYVLDIDKPLVPFEIFDIMVYATQKEFDPDYNTEVNKKVIKPLIYADNDEIKENFEGVI